MLKEESSNKEVVKKSLKSKTLAGRKHQDEMRAVLASINNQERSAASTLNMEKSHETSEDPYAFTAAGMVIEPMKDYNDDGYRPQ